MQSLLFSELNSEPQRFDFNPEDRGKSLGSAGITHRLIKKNGTGKGPHPWNPVPLYETALNYLVFSFLVVFDQ
jgi:hypothetical protein